ncbi:MAG: hypothetical protein KBS81_01690 [Spirochaetales bacterium]|nr:hypothetical protein [Candidatus Physcosoma equi]
MTELTAKAGDSLNTILNTETVDTLSVTLADGVVFTEKVFIKRDNVIVRSEKGATIVWNDHNGMVPGFGTAASATLTISGSNVTLKNITIENSFDYPRMRALRDEGIEKGMGLQAVALFIAPGADSVVLSDCRLLGWQDTLFADGVNNTFEHCYIKGHVDFIFGRATARFLKCTIESCGVGFVTAPSTREECPYGMLFEDCDLIASEGVPEHSVYLARPWHPGGLPGVRSSVRFVNSRLGSHIHPDLWTIMLDTFKRVRTPEESLFEIDERTRSSLH